MASQGPRYPATAASLSEASSLENKDAWVSPANIGADDGTESTITAATFDSPDISQILVASNFGFTIPTGATIDGIVVEIDRRNSAGAASDNRVQLATGTTFATLVGTNKADTALDWPTATAVATYGGVADTWAAGLTVAQINAAGFAVFLSVQADAANTDIQVDYIRVTVYYTAAPDTALAGSAAGVATAAAVLTVPGDNAYEDAVFADSPGAVWSMEEASGNLTDLIAGAVATAAGGPTYGAAGPVAGKTAITFDNVDDSFDAGDLAVADFGTGDFTVEAWFKTASASWNFIASKKGDTGTGAGWQFGLNDAGQFRFELSNGTTHNVYTPSSTGYRDGAWHHAVAKRTGTTLSVRVDKTTLGAGGSSSVDVSTALALRIGRTGETSTFFDGGLAYVALYAAAVADARTDAHYDAAASSGAIVGSSAGVATASGVLTTAIRAAGVSAGVATAAGVLTTAIQIAGTSAGVATAAGVLTTAIPLAGASAGAASAAASLSTQIPLLGSAAGGSTAAGVLTTEIRAVGVSAGAATALGALTTAIPLVGSAAGAGTTAGVLTTQITLAGMAAGVATAAGVLTNAAAQFVGASAGSATTAAALTTQIRFVASTPGAATAAGVLTTTISLAGTSPSGATAGAGLTTAIALTGAAAGVAAASGILPGAAAALVGTAAGSATAAAQLTTTIRLVAESAGVATAAGALATAIALVGSSASSATGTGVLTIPIQLVGIAAGASTATASLAVAAGRGSVGATALPRDTTGIAAVLRDTVVIAHGPSPSSGALAQPIGSGPGAAHNLRDAVGADHE